MPNRTPAAAPRRRMILPLFMAALLLSCASARAEGFYVRAALGVDWTLKTRFRDVDPARGDVAALYGGVTGIDGKPTQTVGDFGAGAGFSLGLGRALTPALRIEAALSYHPKLAFEGAANYRRTPGSQSVTADLSTTSAILTAYLDLPRIGGLRPFIGLGGGLSHARIGRTLMRFPGLSQTTTVPGGRSLNLAWTASAGVAKPLTERLTLDVAWRYADSGDVETAQGNIRVLRPDRDLSILIGETRARLTGHGVWISLRYAFQAGGR